jgi:hypothetical protein
LSYGTSEHFKTVLYIPDNEFGKKATNFCWKSENCAASKKLDSLKGRIHVNSPTEQEVDTNG